jgi:acetyl esterase/lipase
MTNMVYYHTAPPSLESRLVQFFMGLFGMKRAMEKKIVNNSYGKVPAKIPNSILKKFNIEVVEFKDRKVWTLSPRNCENKSIILFLHGGAYSANITQMHWRLVEQLINSTGSTIIVPDYPLTPESTCKDTYQFLDAVYANITTIYSSKQVVFMGDSAGGGLALGFAQKIRDEGLKQPEQIILFSPWLDVSMANSDIAKYEILDKILSVKGLKIAGQNYAGDLDITDYRVSPINGDFTDLGRISIFIGTNEVLIADARRFKNLLENKNIDFDYFEYPGMFHDWVVVPVLKETKDVILKISSYFNE